MSQKKDLNHYLGYTVTRKQIRPQKMQLHTDKLKTLNYFQKLLRDILTRHTDITITQFVSDFAGRH